LVIDVLHEKHCRVVVLLDVPQKEKTLVHSAESAAILNLPPLDILFGKTAAMQAVQNKLERVAETDVPVLIQGESGTGKEICVRLLHAFSMRSQGALVKVSCPAIPHTLLETELFGYEKGAFTGAMSTKLGRVEQSHLGTLFLDEVGSLDLAVQSKLLQVLQDGTFVRVGGHEPRSIDYFIEHYAKLFHHTPELLSKSAVRLMQNYHWPGNIRQLENLIRSYVLIGSEESLVAELAGNSSQRDYDRDRPQRIRFSQKHNEKSHPGSRTSDHT
jgi:two-component system response regulator AtoC